VRRRIALLAGALGCLVLAAFLALLATDVLRWNGALQAGDIRYRATPGASGLWSAHAIGPGGLARELLGIDDDLGFRRTLRALELLKIGGPLNDDPKVILRRAATEAQLQTMAATGGDHVRRSRAANLLGVMELATPASDPQERATLLSRAVADLQKAITLDPNNEEAKYNLEVVLRTTRGVQTAQGGTSPSGSAGRVGARSAASGPPGRGY
jgi:hypothetical protein